MATLDPWILDAVAAPVIVLHRNGCVVFWNSTYSALVGHASDEVAGHDVREFLGPESGGRLTNVITSLSASNPAAILELDWMTRAGGTTRLTLRARLGSPTSGGPVYIVATGLSTKSQHVADPLLPEGAIRSVVLFEDVTERAVLRASYAAYAGIVSLAAEAIIVIDSAQRIVLFNEGAASIFGWSAREVFGQPIELLIPQRLRAGHRAAVEAFARGPVNARSLAASQRTIAGLRRNGDEFPAEAGISKIDLGGSTHLTISLRDVSEKRRQDNEQRFLAHAGATLASSLDYQETLTTVARLAVPLLADCCIVELLDDGTVRGLKVVHVDPTKAQLAADLEAMHVLEPKSHPIWQALEERRSVLLTELPPGYLERLAQTPAHLRLLRELAPVSLISVPLIARTRVLGAISFVSVCREHVYREEDLRLAEELARRAALAMENSQRYTLSQRAVRARDEILGVVAHDLRNPIGVIKLISEALLSKFGDEQQDIRRPAQSISRAVERANRLIQELLDVTRVEGGGLAVKRAPCLPADLLHEALVMLQPAADSASIDLAVASQAELPPIEVDRDRLLQVFSNLAGNAIKFTPREGRVRLAAFRHKEQVCFSVADTGPGITAEQLPHVFDRYWQARPTDCRGAGLGLTIAKGIVEAHGGRIWVESRPGEGSTFFFTVPELGADAKVGSAP